MVVISSQPNGSVDWLRRRRAKGPSKFLITLFLPSLIEIIDYRMKGLGRTNTKKSMYLIKTNPLLHGMGFFYRREIFAGAGGPEIAVRTQQPTAVGPAATHPTRSSRAPLVFFSPSPLPLSLFSLLSSTPTPSPHRRGQLSS